MSHVVTYKVGIHNLETLAAMCERLGLEFHRDVTQFRGYYGQHECQHMISLPGNPERHYQIGVLPHKEQSEEAGFALHFDPWSTGRGVADLKAITGNNMEKMQYEYLHQCALETAQAAGGSISSTETHDAWIFEIEVPDTEAQIWQ